MNKLFFSGCLIALSLTACAPFNNNQPTLAQPITAKQLGLSQHPTTAPISPTWWQALNDPTLNQLIATTLAQSPDLAITTARLRQAQASIGLARSQVIGIQAGIAADGAGLYHESLSNPNNLAEQIFGNDITFGRIQIKGRWTWDLWGEHRNELAAALGKERATQYEIAQTRLLLAQAVTAQYMQLQTLQAQQTLLHQRLTIKQQQEHLVQDRIKAGLMPPSQLYPIQNAIQQLNNAIIELNDKASKIRHALAALSGQPADALNQWQPENIQPLPNTPINSLTSDLLAKRADIAAQREGILARGHLIDAAKAKFYPNVQISAFVGKSVLSIGDFPSLRSLVGAFLPSISLPIFTSGALKANLAQKQAEYDEQVARYNQSVFQSLKEAADALSTYQAASQRLAKQQATLKLAQQSVHATQDRVKAGLETQIAVYSAQDEVIQAQSQLLNIQLQQRVSWVALNVAFGGGFEPYPVAQ